MKFSSIALCLFFDLVTCDLGSAFTTSPTPLTTRSQSMKCAYHLHEDSVINRHSSSLHLTSPNNNSNDKDEEEDSRRKKIRKKVKELAKNIVVKPIESVAPKAIAEVLRDATVGAAEMVSKQENLAKALESDVLVQEAFASAEAALLRAETALKEARDSLENAKELSRKAIDSAEVAAVEEATRAVQVAQEAEQVVSEFARRPELDVSTLTYDDVGYHICEDMGPPFLDEDMCLVPGEAVARVEKARENSRRIFAGIDIMASVDDVWKVLTDYENLQNVIPNLVVNEVEELYNTDSSSDKKLVVDTSMSDEEQCKMLSKQMKGSRLRQVGGAKVVGINFSAQTTLEVREWPQGMPDFAHFREDMYEGKSREERAKENSRVKLKRYRFPRPFALSKLPTRDISMQSLEGKEGGEFRLYQGVWRMQPLPGCAPEGKEAMRLTYAVEVSPRAYLPVSLVEGRIVQDLCTNLAAIRDFVTESVPA